MTGVSLGAVQAVLSGPAASKFAPRLERVGREIENCPVAQKLMGSPSSDLGAFLRQVRDAGLGVRSAGVGNTPAVELRKELDSLDEASLEDLLAILISIREALAEAPAGEAKGTREWGDLRGDLTELPSVPESGGTNPQGAPRGTPAPPPIHYSKTRDASISAGELLAMMQRLRGAGGTGGFAISPPGLDAGQGSRSYPAPIAFPGFTTDTSEQRSVLGTDSVLRGMADAVARGAQASNAADRGVAPDLIYLPVVSSSAAVERIDLVSLVGVGESDPIQTLQDIVRRVEQAVMERQRQRTEGDRILEADMEALVSARLGGPQRPGSGLAFSEVSATEQARIAQQALGQTQAVMADMVERQMMGDVRLDTDRMRAVMHLEPPMLGRLHVQLQVENGTRVQVIVGADQQDTEDFLREHQDELRQGLADQGFDPDQVEIRFEEDKAKDFGRWLGVARV